MQPVFPVPASTVSPDAGSFLYLETVARKMADPQSFPSLEVDTDTIVPRIVEQHCTVCTTERGMVKVIQYPKSGDLYPGPLFDPGCMLVRSLQEKPQLTTRVSTFKTFYEVWDENDEFRKELLEQKDPGSFGKWALRKKYGYNIPATFIPCVARSIYDAIAETLLGRNVSDRSLRVLDPCAGWGDRMVGAMCSEAVGEYVGVDVNEAVFPGYEKLQNAMKTTLKESAPKVKMIHKPFEQCTEEFPDSYFDIVFTSPPFFDYEVYSAENPTYKDWNKDFYTPLVDISRKALKENGLIVFHIDDTSAGAIPPAIKDSSMEMWGVDVGFGKRIAKMWVLRKTPKPKSTNSTTSAMLKVGQMLIKSKGRGKVQATGAVPVAAVERPQQQHDSPTSPTNPSRKRSRSPAADDAPPKPGHAGNVTRADQTRGEGEELPPASNGTNVKENSGARTNEDLPPVVIESYTLDNGKTIRVAREDLLPAGSKQRAGPDYVRRLLADMKKHGKPDVSVLFYASPFNGFGPIACAFTAKALGLKSRVVLARRPIADSKAVSHETVLASENVARLRSVGAEIDIADSWEQLVQRSAEIKAADPSVLAIPLGFNDPWFVDVLVEKFQAALPQNLEPVPKTVWVVGGTGAIGVALARCFPTSSVKIVAANNDAKGVEKVEKTLSRFADLKNMTVVAQHAAPCPARFPTIEGYDKLAWDACAALGESGDLFWNVAGLAE